MKTTAPPKGAIAARTRVGKSASTVASGANVKMSDWPLRAASMNVWSQKLSRKRTNGSEPNGNTAPTASTTRFFWAHHPDWARQNAVMAVAPSES